MRYRLAALGCLLLLFALLVLGARQNSITADEPAYIAGGYALWARGLAAYDLLPQRGYPPLLAALEALPVYLAQPDVPVEQVPGWPDDYDTFTLAFKEYLEPWQRTEAAARLTTILLTVMLGAVVFRWGSDLWGPMAGLIAVVSLTLDPTLLAHGRLAHTDAGAVALGTLALFFAWRWTVRPSWARALATGVALALTLLAKVSGLLWLAAAGLIVLTALVERRRERGNGRLVAQGLGMLIIAGLLWWAAYGLAWGRSAAFPFPVPAPAYWDGMQFLRDYVADVFALGMRQRGSWWWYFPVAFLIKNPLPLLIALGIALVALAQARRRGARHAQPATRLVALAAFPFLYSVVAIADGMNIGYRHMLPVHPFLYLVIGGGLAYWAWRPRARRWYRWVVAGLALWTALSVLRVFPWEIAYGSELIGGSSNTYRYLADSNVDWGQADRVRDAYLASHVGVQIGPPEARFSPAPGRYLVGAGKLQGTGTADVDAYEWFRHREPVAMLAYSQLVFDVPANAPQWLVQCTNPVAPLTEAAITRGTGQSDLRTIGVDCSQAWIYPHGSSTGGLYVLHHALLDERQLCLPSLLPCPAEASDAFARRHLVGTHLAYQQAVDGELPAFVLYATHEVPSLEAPPMVAFDGPLTLIDVVAYVSASGLDVETHWRVVGGSVDRPFSIMGHLLDEQGNTVAVADGLGVSPLALQPGDVLVQRHRFPATAARRLLFQTGAYWLDDLTRWPRADSASDTIVLPLQKLVQPDGQTD